MNLADVVMEKTFVYRVWQAPFAGQKFVPVLEHNDLKQARRVLDVACGPGTNTKYFDDADYLGIDINERYINDARLRHGRDFLVADVRNYVAPPEARFDFILINSFLHHLNTPDILSILTHLKSLLTADGHIHMLELVMPERPSIARLLARSDRGKFARPLQEWKELFENLFEPVVFEPYRLTGMGATLWNMVYFKGKVKA
jgi:SAM-dependent methyltransferase